MILLITGIHGFVGSNLVSTLKKHHTIYGLDIVSPQKEGIVKTFGWQELEQIPSVDLIIHLAGKAHDTKRGGDCMSGEKRRRGNWAAGIRIFSRNEKKQDDMRHRLLRDPGICAVVQD